MRMWCVPTKLMCRQHLLGEHLELHMFVSSYIKGKNLLGFVRNGLLDHSNVFERHEEIVKEMEARGYNHKSPIYAFRTFELGLTYSNHPVTLDPEKNLKVLADRCRECRRLQSKYQLWQD